MIVWMNEASIPDASGAAAPYRLQAHVRRMGRRPLLSGWTRGHVLAHIARAAEAHGNLLE
jgi:hypothetical protein